MPDHHFQLRMAGPGLHLCRFCNAGQQAMDRQVKSLPETHHDQT